MVVGAFESKGVVLTEDPLVVAVSNINRKGIAFSNSGETPVLVAIGEAPADTDYFPVPVGSLVQFYNLVPIGKITAKGPGTLVVFEVV